MKTENTSKFKTRWDDYVRGTNISGGQVVIELLECCNEPQGKDVMRTHGSLTNKTGKIIEVRQFDQYVVKVDDSGRVRNRKFLRQYTPVQMQRPIIMIEKDIQLPKTKTPQISPPLQTPEADPETEPEAPPDSDSRQLQTKGPPEHSTSDLQRPNGPLPTVNMQNTAPAVSHDDSPAFQHELQPSSSPNSPPENPVMDMKTTEHHATSRQQQSQPLHITCYGRQE